jgi:hypothetical protein
LCYIKLGTELSRCTPNGATPIKNVVDKKCDALISVDGSVDLPNGLFGQTAILASLRFPIMLEITIRILSGHGLCITKYP